MSSGDIIVAGSISGEGGDTVAVAAYTSDGSLDEDFGSGGIVTSDEIYMSQYEHSMTVDSSGRITVVGHGYDTNDQDQFCRHAVHQFRQPGQQFWLRRRGDHQLRQFRLWRAGHGGGGRWLWWGCGGRELNQEMVLVHYNSDGNLDSNFGDSGIVTTSINGSELPLRLGAFAQLRYRGGRDDLRFQQWPLLGHGMLRFQPATWTATLATRAL